MGGPAIHVSNLAAGLETRGYHTTLVAGSLPRGEDSMAYVAERLGVSVVSVPEIQREVAPLHDARAICGSPRSCAPSGRTSSTRTRPRQARSRELPRSSRERATPIVVHTFHGRLKGYFGPGRTAFFRQVEADARADVGRPRRRQPRGSRRARRERHRPDEKFTVIRLGIPLDERLGDETADSTTDACTASRRMPSSSAGSAA